MVVTEIEELKKFAKLSKQAGEDFFMHPDAAIAMFERVEGLQSRLEELEKENASLKQDAARYRWIRQLDNAFDYTVLSRNWKRAHTPQQLDATIDAAMQANKETNA